MPWATPRPTSFTIRHSKVARGAQDFTEEICEFAIQGMGLNWEADAVARDIRGKPNSPRTDQYDRPHHYTRREDRKRENAARGDFIGVEHFRRDTASRWI